MHPMVRFALAAVLLVSSLSASALGPPRTGYFGAGAGVLLGSDFADDHGASLERLPSAHASRRDVGDARTAWRVYGGYSLSQRFAVEASYHGALSMSDKRSILVGGQPVPTIGSASGTAFSAAGLLALPNRTWITPFVKGGAYYGSAETSWRDHLGETETVEDDGVGALFGLGVDYRIATRHSREQHPVRGGHWSIRADYDWLVGGPLEGGHAFTVGVAYRFF